MNPAPNVKKAGNSPNGSKLIARFPGPDFPTEVTVKGTTDTKTTNGGAWLSENKYTDKPPVTLVLSPSGEEFSYDANGALVNADAAVTGFTLNPVGNLGVNISWTTTKENSVLMYIIDRRLQGAATYEEGVQVVFVDDLTVPKGYSIAEPDVVPAAGTYEYQLRARFENGTFKTLANGTVQVS